VAGPQVKDGAGAGGGGIGWCAGARLGIMIVRWVYQSGRGRGAEGDGGGGGGGGATEGR